MKENTIENYGNIAEQIKRACLFCDAYGLSIDHRKDLVDLIILRIEALIKFLINYASKGEDKYIGNMQEGHHLKYLIDIEYIKQHKAAIQNSLV